MKRTLVLGYGNLDRGDDGLAYTLINNLRCSLGQEALVEGATGLEELGAEVDSAFVPQLVPELIDVVAAYDRVIFADAHVHPNAEEVRCTAVQAEYTASAFTHHLTPAAFMALLQVVHQRRPASFVLSVRGHSFAFERGLSAVTSASIASATKQMLRLLDGGVNASSSSH